MRPKSNRFEPITYDIPNLEDPIAIRFINAAKTDADTLAFMARFGLPTKINEAYLPSMTLAAKHAKKLLGADNEADKVRRANKALEAVTLTPEFDRNGPGGAARLVMHPDTLMDLIQLEIAFAHEAGAVLASCEQCSKHFLTGPLTGRRSHAKFCSDKCRKAAMRKRNMEKGDR